MTPDSRVDNWQSTHTHLAGQLNPVSLAWVRPRVAVHGDGERGDKGGTARRRVNAGLSFGGGVARCVAGRAVLRAASLRRTDVREIWPLGESRLSGSATASLRVCDV